MSVKKIPDGRGPLVMTPDEEALDDVEDEELARARGTLPSITRITTSTPTAQWLRSLRRFMRGMRFAPSLSRGPSRQREAGLPPIPRSMSCIVDLTTIVQCLPTFGYKTVTSGRVVLG